MERHVVWRQRVADTGRGPTGNLTLGTAANRTREKVPKSDQWMSLVVIRNEDWMARRPLVTGRAKPTLPEQGRPT